MTERRQSQYDWMIPEERFRRIVDLLAAAVIRIAQEESSTPVKKSPSPPTIHDSLRPTAKGRIPYGERQTPVGRSINPSEEHWLKRIRELSADGLSSEGIAKHLNQEDRESKRAGKWSRTAVWRILQRSKKKAVTE